LKIAPLLADFLLRHQRLDLPGIGSILLESEQTPGMGLTGARFEPGTGNREPAELIQFIAEQTGKQKTLAASDLDSHLENVKQFLNIGKPYHFEGIGTLTKLQSGEFSFTPGAEIVEKIAGKSIRETEEQDADENSGGFKSIFYSRKTKTDSRKTLFIFLLIIGLGLAIWGGYTVYKKTTARKAGTVTTETKADGNETSGVQPIITDSTLIRTDSHTVRLDTLKTESIPVPGQYKFVVEAANKTRGLNRYALLKGFGLPVEMETRDSVTFKIFFRLPANAMDTARLRDSLQRLYSPLGSKAFVEN